uniref:Phospholipid/glycerol acyltransferase domain-containing protein n=1 Tax=Varanus komodoensis TaxID=61221 RepID=A0A8D2IVG7_VARKO
IENLPEGPGLVIYYHGAIPLDYLFFIARLYVTQRKICCSVVDRFVFKIPGFRRLLEKLFMNCTKEDCYSALKTYLLGVAPGGTREGLYSNSDYPIVWAKRIGFAQLAIDTKVVTWNHFIMEHTLRGCTCWWIIGNVTNTLA